MRNGKLISILIAIAFFVIALFSCFMLFSVKKVDVDYMVDSDTDTTSVQTQLDKFIGTNLLFFNGNAVALSLEDFHYMEVLSVYKQYPNVIKVEIKQRREVYEIAHDGKIYVTTADGFVLRVEDDLGQENGREKIRLHLDGIEILDGTLGKTISTTDDEMMKQVFDMADAVWLTDCIKSVTVEKDVLEQNAIFNTYTGVKIIVPEMLDEGVKKIQTAFEKYDLGASDYEKTFRSMMVIKLHTGIIEAQWIS